MANITTELAIPPMDGSGSNFTTSPRNPKGNERRKKQNGGSKYIDPLVTRMRTTGSRQTEPLFYLQKAENTVDYMI
jgi:hypothetical protein